MDLHIDLGQMLIVAATSVLGIIGFLIRSEVSAFRIKLDIHENHIFKLVQDVSRLLGRQDVWDGHHDRREK